MPNAHIATEDRKECLRAKKTRHCFLWLQRQNNTIMKYTVFYPSGIEIMIASLNFASSSTDDNNKKSCYSQMIDKLQSIDKGSAENVTRDEIIEIARCVAVLFSTMVSNGKVAPDSKWSDKQWTEVDDLLNKLGYDSTADYYAVSKYNKKTHSMQKYVSQPSYLLDGTYEVARWNEVANQYEVIERNFPKEEQARERALHINEQYQQDLHEFENQDALIDKYHTFAQSSDTQKRNAAREFFMRFPYQRDVCNSILREAYNM